MTENTRLQAATRFIEITTEKDPELLEIAELAALVAHTPYAMISFLDYDTQHIKVSKGLNDTKIPREKSFCAYTIQQNALMLIADAHKDKRFSNNPLVTDHGIKFYAGVPLKTCDGQNIGTLCLLDIVEHTLTDHQQLALEILAKQVVRTIELKLRQGILEHPNQALLKIAHIQAHDFRAPLTSIMGLMSLIKQEDYNAPKEYLELLQEAVYTLDGKIRKIVSDVDAKFSKDATAVAH